MILLTGAAGFIGSCLLEHLNKRGYKDIVLVDDFSKTDKLLNLQGKVYREKVQRLELDTWLQKEGQAIDFVIHMGARTDTSEQDVSLFNQLNLHYTQSLIQFCTLNSIPIIYASSAATYGMGELGYDDQLSPSQLQPMNPYAHSKNDLDHWLLQQKEQPPFWAGLKFFNVYGPNEYHKGRMASVILHSHRQISKTGGMKLFRSHKEGIANGEQSRDFIYIKDLMSIVDFFMHNGQSNLSGLYNVGTGKARSFYDLVSNTFKAMDLQENISFIDTPIDIRDSYQYFTQARTEKLRKAGYNQPFYSLEEGVEEYVKDYLNKKAFY